MTKHSPRVKYDPAVAALCAALCLALAGCGGPPATSPFKPGDKVRVKDLGVSGVVTQSPLGFAPAYTRLNYVDKNGVIHSHQTPTTNLELLPTKE